MISLWRTLQIISSSVVMVMTACMVQMVMIHSAVVGDDRLYGSYGKDIMSGGDGDDRLYGDYGNDILNGGLGDDRIDGGAGKDTIVFGDNNTVLSLSNDYDGLAQNTGHGSDTIVTSTIENVTSGSGNDIIIANAFDNVILSGDGDDRLYGDAGDDTLTAGLGNDRLYGSYGDDSLTGDDGDDRLYGDYGDDILDGGLGNDLIDGGSGKDTLIFGNQDTTVSLAADQDGVVQDTGHGSDTIMTTTIENVTSGSGNDSITGNVLDNILDGGAGNDTLFGSYGDDELIGGFGDDTLTGGFGDDTLTGGSGNDTFVFGEIFGDDTIKDFNAAAIRPIVFGPLIGTIPSDPNYTYITEVNGHFIYQDNTTEEVVTDTGGSNSTKVVITDIDGVAYTDPTQIPNSGTEWYRNDPIGDKIDLSALTGSTVNAVEDNGHVQLNISDTTTEKIHGSITLDNMSLEEWNALDQEF